MFIGALLPLRAAALGKVSARYLCFLFRRPGVRLTRRACASPFAFIQALALVLFDETLRLGRRASVVLVLALVAVLAVPSLELIA